MTAGSADLVYRGCTGFAILGAGFAAGFFLQSWLRAPSTSRKSKLLKSDSVVDLIGNTPLIRIKSLSEATGCEIYGKAEFTNPGGSVKDRVALHIVEEALHSGQLHPGGTIFEGTAGSTGVSLAMVSAALGCKAHVVLPDEAAIEKAQLLTAYGATVERVRPVSISHRDHFVNIARRKAEDTEGGFFSNQFENLANFRAHLKTGEEIYNQTGGRLDAFVCAAGTGGTIAGISKCLKSKVKDVQVYLIDPPGSSLFNRVKRGVMYTSVEAEGKRLKNPFDTITEGIGINRLTKNFIQGEALIDDALQGTDYEAVEMARHLVKEDALFVGSSSAMNCVGAVKVAQKLGPGHTIVTILCDGGQRHLSKFHNPQYLKEYFANQ
jgi:cysteine synthase A